MKTWKRAFKEAVFAGTFAGLTSLAGMVVGSRRENGTSWASVNAPSHWLWGEKALKQNHPTLRYTVAGLLIHQLSAGFWGIVHQKALGGSERTKSAAELLRDAALTTAVAAWVDLALVPERLTPGFQRRLSGPTLVGVYALFGLGLAAGSYLLGRRRRLGFSV